jgi:gliding motility-associated-like protein
MKKISLFLFILLLSVSSRAQLAEESFESWTAGQGPANWKILQNTIGTSVQWAQSVAANTLTPPRTGQHAAYLNFLNVTTGIPEDYLVTPLFNAPVNGRIYFYSRLTMPLDQGSIFKVKILPAGADADDINNYIDLQSWTEFEINPLQLEYNKITVDIPQIYENTNIRVAFVLAADNGDRWLIDDVKVAAECPMPENLLASGITQTSAALTWDNPAGATQFEVEFLEDSEPAMGTGVPYNSTLPYQVNNLTPGTDYKFYVRALCADGGESDWAGPFNFLTIKPGDNCQNPKIITSLPYANTDDTVNYFDNINGSPGGCGVPSSQNYLNGNDVFYAYTATQTGVVSINLTGITETYVGIFVYTSCGDIGTSCYEGAINDYMTPAPDINIPMMNVTAGTTYYIVISGWFSQTTGYTLNIQQELCDRPTGLTATLPAYDGITLGWTSSFSSWEIVTQPVGTGLPMGAGQTVTSNPITLTTLNPSTQYELYVRANCGNGTFSSWAGPLVFNTLCNTFTVPYFEGFNTGSESQFCWNIADNNNDGVVWDMDFTYSAFEGDQSAKFDVGSTSANDDMLISPAIMLTGNERLKFHYKSQVSGAVAFKIMASATGNAPEDFTIEVSPLASYAVNDFTEKIVNVSNLPAGPVYFAWYIPVGVNGGYEIMIDNVIVETMPACAEPTDITSNDVLEDTAHIAWTAGNNENAWEIIVGDADVIGTPNDSTVGVPCTSAQYNASGLTPNTVQGVYVRSVCGTTSKSVWAGPYYFTTKCTPLPIPFFEGFNSDSTTENCWKVANGNGDWAEWSMSENPAFEGDEAAKLYTGNAANNDWLISPALMLTGNERLKFHFRVGDASEGDTGFKVLLSATSSDLEDFTTVLVPETIYTNEDYQVKVVSLAGYTGQVYLAWQVPPTAEFGSDLMIDNVIVEPMPACPEPLYVELSDITTTSAQVTWTPGNTETAWELFINVDGEAAPAVGIPVTALPYIITALPDGTPLTSGTLYEITVKAVCSGTESSIMSDKVKFVTLITNDECTAPVTVPVNSGPSCEVYASGTLNGATTSTPQDTPCGEWVSVNEDVWFEFTATSSTHTVTFFDMPQGSSQFTYIIYKGDDCGNLEGISFCNTASWEYNSTNLLEGLTPGTKYKIRIFNTESAPVTTTFKVCVKIPVAPITVSTDQYTVEQLVTDVLFEGGCAQISNITWSTGTNYPDPDYPFGDNPSGIGYFNKAGSGFPFDEGIVLTTGDVNKVPGPDYRTMEQGSPVWLGDTDIDAVMEGFLGAPPFQPSTNASVIEFDFVPTLPTLSLDFMFASEEYGDYIQCFSYDTFVILLTDANGNTQNIALIPGTTIPISVFNISGAGYPNICPGYNLEWFGKYNVFGQQDYSPTAFAGQTVVMTATANLEVNQPYHLKIAIAETDMNLDSGVFIKAGIDGGNGAVPVDLGPDMLVASNNALCQGQTATIESGLDDATFDFIWKQNGNIIPNETLPTLVVSEPGEYSVSVNVTGFNCFSEDSIVVEFYPSVEDTTGNPADLTVCDADGFAEFDLSVNTAVILQGLNTADYMVSYHATADNATDNTGALASPYTNTVQTEQTIYVRIQNNNTQCYAVKAFALRAQDLTPQFTLEGDFVSCRAEDVTITVVPANFDIADATFSWTLDGDALGENGSSIQATAFGTYGVTVVIENCTHSENITVTHDDTVIEIAFLEGCENNIYMLEAIAVDGSFNMDTASYAWTGPEGFTSAERKFAAPMIGDYNVVITTDEGCMGEAEFIVAETTCDVPRGISPNNDGFNDELDLTALNVKKLSIFNRYGQEVYSKTDYTKEWKGQDSSGKELPTGTYFYVLERAQGESKTGWVYINRQD